MYIIVTLRPAMCNKGGGGGHINFDRSTEVRLHETVVRL